ncbi:17061_t:CDS:1, partial [Gigaspora rosea]
MDDFLSLSHFDTFEDDNHMPNAPLSFNTNYYDQEHMSSSYLNAHKHETINILSPSYFDIYQHGFMNALSSPYSNDYDLAG